MGTGQPGSATQHIQRLFAEGTLTGVSDAELLERYLARRDELAFEALVERHAALVLAVCRRSLKDTSVVDDAFQATFLVLARRSRAVRDRKVLGSWLFGVAHRICLLANRAAARRRKHEQRAAQRKGVRGTTVVEHEEPGSLIDEEVERLPSAYRLPVVLCLMEGRSRAEAAEALQWTEGMVRGRLARARRLLRARLIRRGVGPAAALAVLAREGTAAGAVPRGLIENAARTATRAAAERVSVATLALTKEVIKIMLLKKLTMFAAVFLASIVVVWAATAALSAGTDESPPAGAAQSAPVPTAPRGDIELDDPGKSALHGRVLDPDGNAVAGARVWINDQYGQKRPVEARTDAAGRFQLGPFEPQYRNGRLVVDADGFARLKTTRTAVLTFPGLDSDLGDLRVERGRVFTGQVLDVDGKPRPDVWIELRVCRYYFGHSVEDIGPGQPLTADAEGRFRTEPLPVGRLYLEVHAPERQASFVDRMVRPGGKEDLGPIRLEALMEKEASVTGIVRDDAGEPIAGVKIACSDSSATTDPEGRFTLHCLARMRSFPINVSKAGYESLGERVSVTAAGALPTGPRSDAQATRPVKEHVLTLRRCRTGWFVGKAIDADTLEPVRLDSVGVYKVERKPEGQMGLQGRQSDFFQQIDEPGTGQFEVSFSGPGEFRLTFSAAGYKDAEFDPPTVTEPKVFEGLVVPMKKKVPVSMLATVRRTITGTVTREGRPVKSGWVALWSLPKPSNVINASIVRGRTVVESPQVFAAPLREGAYTLDVPFLSDRWYVVVEQPGQPLTQVGPIPIVLNENGTLDIACTEGGRIRGRVKDVPPGWEGHLWVIAFSKSAIHEETRVALDGTFSLPPLPPGQYGVKAGHNAYEDAEVYPGPLIDAHPAAFSEMADPWKRAKVVTVEAGRETSGVELELPKSHRKDKLE